MREICEPTIQERSWDDYEALTTTQEFGASWTSACTIAAIRVLAEAGLAPSQNETPLELPVADASFGRYHLSLSRDRHVIRVILVDADRISSLDAEGDDAIELCHLTQVIVSILNGSPMPVDFTGIARDRRGKKGRQVRTIKR